MENTSAVTFSLAPGKESEYILAIAVPVQSATGVGIAIAFSTQADLLGGANFMTYPCTILSDDATLYSNASEMPDADALRAFAALPDQAPDGRNLIHLSLEAVGWDLFFEYPLSVVDSRLESSLTRWSVLSILIFALIEGLLILSIYKIIVAPILNISNQSTRITSTSNMLDNPAGGRNELNLLVRNINDMIVRTNLLTGEVKDAKLRLMQMDITRLQERNMFLQAQINPHFLYNMLECICGMSAQEGNYAVRDMTHLLSKLYQYSLRSPDSTLGEEFE
ncbi:MAG: histidine kinase [Clostridia bacterium]